MSQECSENTNVNLLSNRPGVTGAVNSTKSFMIRCLINLVMIFLNNLMKRLIA